MPTKLGRLAQIGISIDGGSSYQDIARLVDGTIELTQDTTETTSHDSNGFREYEGTFVSGQVTANFIYDENETEQEELYNSILTRTPRFFRFVTQSGVGNAQITANGIITNLSHGAPLNDMQTLDLTVQFTGTITRADQ